MKRIVLIGASTGGVEALETVLSDFPADCPATLVCQHMPQHFLQSFSARLNKSIRPEVSVAQQGQKLERGRVFLAPGGDTHLEVAGDWPGHCRLSHCGRVNGHIPSVDVLFCSARMFSNRVIAVLLTGMGCDGARGLLALKQAGAITIGQDETSSCVYGMPRVAKEIGALTHQFALPDISESILSNSQIPSSSGR